MCHYNYISLLINQLLCRDWRGLADAFSLGGEIISSIAANSDPTGNILNAVINKNSKCMIEELQKILERIDRWDVIDETQPLFGNYLF